MERGSGGGDDEELTLTLKNETKKNSLSLSLSLSITFLSFSLTLETPRSLIFLLSSNPENSQMSAPEAHGEDTEMLAKWREVREQIAGARAGRRAAEKEKELSESGGGGGS